MSTIISECFEEINGPLLIMLPGICPGEHLKLHAKLGEDIFENQRRFMRSGVIFISDINIDESRRFERTKRHTAPYLDQIFPNQLHLLLLICSEIRTNVLTSTAIETISKLLLTQRESWNTKKRRSLNLSTSCTLYQA